MAKSRFVGPGSSGDPIGQMMAKIHNTSVRQVPKDIVVKDIAAVIRRIPLTQDEILLLYDAIKGRVAHKMCQRCGVLTAVGIEGKQLKADWAEKNVFYNRYICNACTTILKEKSVG